MDVWGVSEKLDAYLKIKKAARDRTEHSAGGGGGGGAWGVWGGAGAGAAGGTGTKGKTAGGAFLDERRREEADRIRGHLDRVVHPSLWERVRKEGREGRREGGAEGRT